MNPRKAFEQSLIATREEEYDAHYKMHVAEEVANLVVKLIKTKYPIELLGLGTAKLREIQERIESVVYDSLWE